jgi:probable rRNA maturation factor
LIATLLHHLGLGDCELSLGFVSSSKMRNLNQTFRQKDRTTDVLSFPQNTWKVPLRFQKHGGGRGQLKKTADPHTISGPVVSGGLVLGDLVISLPEAEKNAQKIGQTLDREVCFLIVHGLLHLCGHDHMNPIEEQIMLHQQKKAMELLDQGSASQTFNKPLWHQSIARHKQRPLKK